MKRSKAEELLDQIRTALAARCQPDELEAKLLKEHGIQPLELCPGSAHSNAFIDNCTQCAPRWGWKGERIKIT